VEPAVLSEMAVERKVFRVLKVVAMATLPRGKAGRTMNEKVL